MVRAARRALGLALLAAAAPQERRPPLDTLPAVLPDAVPLGLPPELVAQAESEAVVALGRRLFFDPVLSADRSVACASCHDPSTGFADARPRSLGVGGQQTLRHAPSLWNRALGRAFGWDGRAATLEEQVLLPIENPREMGLALEGALARLERDADQAAAFRAAFGGPPDRARLARALAAFVRRLWRGDSPVDRFRAGDREALGPRARGGLWLFESKAGCWRCHGGPNFTDEAFHNTGVGLRDGVPAAGRFAVTGARADRGAFKTPTLRGVGHTAPYMHDGSLATLEEVVELYRQGGRPNPQLDPAIAPLDLTDRDVQDLVAFLRAL